MIISGDNLHPFAGAEVCGQTLVPNDESTLYACYPCRNVAVGVSFDPGDNIPYLRLLPAIQIPKFARTRIKELLFTHSDDRFGDLTIDERDGEVIMRRAMRDRTVEASERELRDCLNFLDEVAHPAMLATIARAHRESQRKNSDDSSL